MGPIIQLREIINVNNSPHLPTAISKSDFGIRCPEKSQQKIKLCDKLRISLIKQFP